MTAFSLGKNVFYYSIPFLFILLLLNLNIDFPGWYNFVYPFIFQLKITLFKLCFL